MIKIRHINSTEALTLLLITADLKLREMNSLCLNLISIMTIYQLDTDSCMLGTCLYNISCSSFVIKKSSLKSERKVRVPLLYTGKLFL